MVKKETLKLIETWITKSEDVNLVVENFLPPLLEAVLGDYARNIPQAREPEVLSLMTAIIKKLQVCFACPVLTMRPNAAREPDFPFFVVRPDTVKQ